MLYIVKKGEVIFMKNVSAIISLLVFIFCFWSPAVENESSQRRMGIVRDKERKSVEKPSVETIPSFVLEETVENEQRIFAEEDLEFEEVERRELVARDMPEYLEGKWIQREPIESTDEKLSAIDLLFISNNTRSMQNILTSINKKWDPSIESLKLNTEEGIEEKKPSFLDILDSSVDWQAAFMSAEVLRDENQERLFRLENEGFLLDQKILTNRVENYPRVFLDTLTRNVENPCEFPPGCSRRKARPLSAFEQFLQSESARTFMRDTADLVVVILTNNREKRGRGGLTLPEDITSLFKSLHGQGKRLYVYGVTLLENRCSEEDMRSNPFALRRSRSASLVQRLVQMTGGQSFDICQESYVPIAEAIQKAVANDKE